MTAPRVSDARPWLLGGGARRKPARLAACIGTTRSTPKAAAMRAAGVEPVDWADAAAVEAAIARADGILVSLPPDGIGDPVLVAPRGRARGRRIARGSAISRPPGSTATGRAAGSTRRARSRRSPSAGAGGWRRRRAWARDRAAGAGLPAGRDLRAGPQRARPAARGAGAAGGEAGPGLQPDPRRRHRGGARRLDGAAGPGAGLQRRRRRAGAAAGRDRLRGGAPRDAGAAGGAARGGGALADGAELLRGVRSGWRTGGSRRSSGCGSPIPTIAPGSGRSSPPAVEGPRQQALGEIRRAIRFPVWQSPPASAKNSRKVGRTAATAPIEVGGMQRTSACAQELPCWR